MGKKRDTEKAVTRRCGSMMRRKRSRKGRVGTGAPGPASNSACSSWVRCFPWGRNVCCSRPPSSISLLLAHAVSHSLTSFIGDDERRSFVACHSTQRHLPMSHSQTNFIGEEPRANRLKFGKALLAMSEGRAAVAVRKGPHLHGKQILSRRGEGGGRRGGSLGKRLCPR